MREELVTKLVTMVFFYEIGIGTEYRHNNIKKLKKTFILYFLFAKTLSHQLIQILKKIQV